MKVARIHEHGSPDKLILEEIPEPAIRHGEALVKVEACAMNHLDLWVRAGLPRVNFNLPRILGSDISGVVAEIKDDGSSFRVGDEVIIYPATFCGKCEHCLAGRQTLCKSYFVIGTLTDGGNAEYVKIPSGNLIAKPANLNFEEAASFPLVFLTAWHMLKGLADVREGMDVFILGAGSGVGIASIQVAKLFGANVITTASSEEKLEKAKELGADHVFNYKKSDIFKSVTEYTGGAGVDIVIEHVGQSTFGSSIRALKSGGTLVTCGATTGPKADLDLRHLFGRQLKIYGSYMGYFSELLEVTKYINTGELKPVIDSVFALEDASAAHTYLESSKHFGKVIIKP